MSEIGQSSFIDVAKALAPQIREFAGEIEQSRRLPSSLVDAITGAGLFRLWLPRSLGGEETDPMTFVRVVEEVSRADGATGWCVALIGEYGVFSGYLPPESAYEIYGNDPNVRTAGQLRSSGEARVVDGGYRVTGRGRWEVAVSMRTGSWAVAGFSTVMSHASERTAHRSCAFFFSRPQTAKSSTLGTVSGCAAPAAMTIPSPMFSSRPLAHYPFGNRLSNQGLSMQCPPSRCSAPRSRRSRSASHVMP